MEWQNNQPKDALDWTETIDYLSKNENYRLPTKEELALAFQNKTEGFKESLYWTGDQLESINSVFFVDFYKGVVSFCGKDSKLFVRLIKKN